MKNEMIFAAFNAWQIVETMKNMFGVTQSQSFNDYLKALGLHEKDETPQNNNSEEALEKERKRALETAENIVHLFKKGRDNSA